jgi:regulator of protease activity HflC (stomatin/prohibitin superfamily)
MYGGDTVAEGSPGRQEFPVDTFSQEMFSREGMDVSNTNVWAMEVEPAQAFVYELARRDSDRLFRVAFDLTTPVVAPPAPWGAE